MLSEVCTLHICSTINVPAARSQFLRFHRMCPLVPLLFCPHGTFHFFACTLSHNVHGSIINVPTVHESWSHWFPLVPTGNWLPLIRIGYPCSHSFRWISLVSSVPSAAHWFSLVPLSSHRFPLGPTGSHKFPQHHPPYTNQLAWTSSSVY